MYVSENTVNYPELLLSFLTVLIRTPEIGSLDRFAPSNVRAFIMIHEAVNLFV